MIHLVIAASPIEIASAWIFALLALLWLDIAFRCRLGTPSVESPFYSISWLSLR